MSYLHPYQSLWEWMWPTAFAYLNLPASKPDIFFCWVLGRGSVTDAAASSSAAETAAETASDRSILKESRGVSSISSVSSGVTRKLNSVSDADENKPVAERLSHIEVATSVNAKKHRDFRNAKKRFLKSQPPYQIVKESTQDSLPSECAPVWRRDTDGEQPVPRRTTRHMLDSFPLCRRKCEHHFRNKPG